MTAGCIATRKRQVQRQANRRYQREWSRSRRATDPEFKARQNAHARDYQRRKRQDPAYRAAQDEARARRAKTPEGKARRNERQRERYASDPAFRRRVLDQRNARYRQHLPDLLKRQGYQCALCGGTLDPEATGREGPTVDHIVPQSKGGSDDPSNLQAAHMHCNAGKGNR